MALSEETKRKLNEARSTTLGGGEASRPSSLSDDTKAKLDAAKGDLFTKTPEQTERENAVAFADQFGELKKRYEQQRNLTAMRESLGLPDINTFSPEERKQAQEMGEYMRGQQASQVIEDFAEKHPVTGTVMGSIGSLGGATEYFKALKEGMQGGRYTGYDSYNGGSVVIPSPTRISQAATSGATRATAKNLANVVRTVNNTIPFFETDEEAEAWGSRLGEDLQSIANSQIQSLATRALLGQYGALLLGGSAASSAYLEAVDRGDTVKEALLHGVASGMAEAIPEFLPIDKLADIMRHGLSSVRTLIKQTAAEGLEEGMTDILSTMADALIYVKPEDLDKAVAVELAAGKGNAKAYVDALSNVVFDGLSKMELAEVGRDMALGAVGGLLGGGTAALGNRIATNVSDVSAGDMLKKTGVTPQSLADAAKATGAETKTAEKMTRRQMGKAYRAINEANTRTAIEVRLAQNGVSDPKAVADIIVKAVRDEESLTSEERRTLEDSKAKQVWEDVKEYATTPSDSSWLSSAGQATNVAARIGVNQEENRSLIESLQRMSDAGETLESVAKEYEDATTHEYRAEELAETAEQIGLSADEITTAYGKRDDVGLARYATALKLAYEYGRAGMRLEEVSNTTGLSTDDAINAAYENGKKAYIGSKRGEVTRVKASSAKVKYISQAALDKKNPKFMAVDLDAMSPKERTIVQSFAKLLDKVIAPRVHRTIYLFDGGDAKTNGWNDATGIYINVNAKNGTRTFDMLGTFFHEFGHEIRMESPELFDELRQIVIDNWYRGDRGAFDAAVRGKIADRARTVKEYGEGNYLDEEKAVEEIVCESLSKLAEHPEAVEKVFIGHETLAKRALTFFKKILDAVKQAIASITGKSNMYAEMMDTEALEKCVDVLSRYVEEINQKVNQAAETAETTEAVETTEAEAKEQYLETHRMYNIQYNEQHTEDLKKNYDAKNASVSLADLLRRRNAIIDIWNEIGGELNSEFLKAWNEKDYKNRAFTIFKEQMGYKYAGELASMCKKGIPLFEAIDSIVREGVIDRLNSKRLGPGEKAVLYDILKSEGFEIPCAICYVEQARRGEARIISNFVVGDGDVKLGWNQVLDDVEKRMAKAGIDYKFPTAPDSIMTEVYAPVDTNMDERTQTAFYEALREACNEEILAVNERIKNDKHKKKKNYRSLLQGTSPKEVAKVLGGTLPSNLKIFKVLFQNVDARFRLVEKHLYNSQTTLNLSAHHNNLYSLFNSQGGTSGYKTKQGTVVYAGDILSKKWDTSDMREELGLRSQSNSDFLMYTLVDKMQMLIDLSAKGYYAHEYTKVPSNVQLFGLSGAKMLMSCIPMVHRYYNADGTVDVEKTMENAGLDENGNPIYDNVEGINKDFAFMIAQDKNYSKNVGINCIGYSDKHIIALLNTPFISQIIGFHDKTNDPEKRYVGAKYAKNYNGINEAVNAAGKTVHLSFSKFLIEAEKELQTNPNTDVPRRAAALYLEYCKSHNYSPAYNIPGIVDHPNYYRLLCDFNCYDSEGNYAPHNRVAFDMPMTVPALDTNGNKVMISSRDVIRSELRKEVNMRESLAEKMPRIMDKFVEVANSLGAPAEETVRSADEGTDDTSYSTQDAESAPTFYSQMGKVIEQQKANKFDARTLINMLLGKGVKAEEIKWSGIAAWLDGKKSVTKEELQEFVRGSMLQVEDEWLTNRNWDSNNWEDYDAAESYTYTEARTIIDDMVQFDELKDGKAAQRSLHVDYEDDIFYAYANIDGEEKMILKYNPGERATRWAQYTLPYTENYRELKLKLPGADYSNKAMEAHWRESGVLAHARVGDVFEEAEPIIDPETGEVHPIFFIEEIQSDWHNVGNKSGYLSAEDTRKRTEGVKALDDLKTLIDYGLESPSDEEFETQVNDILANMGSTMRIENHASGYLIYDEGLRRSSFLSQRVTLRRLLNILSEDAPAPEAPFKDGKYVDFVMKKLLRTAAEEGYHKIGWTTAKQQSERWSDSYAEGYRIEYDQDIPKFLNKYGKQWGAKASQETLRNGDVIWTFPINEAMRNSVIYEGQPMYSMQDIEDSTTVRSASMFSGGGLLEQGLEYQLLTHDFGVERDTSIAATWLENNRNGHIYAGKEEGDVLNFDVTKYKGRLFHFHASPVCHNFSPAKQNAKESEQDRAMARAVLRNFIDSQAPVCTVENGPYYIKSESAKIIIDGLRAAGYAVDADVYNSADYGSPQSRQRTIIRAVKGMELPPKPRTIPRTNTWDRVTRDLWESLPEITESDIAESYRKAVKATGIDINNVKVPTLLLQTASNGKVAYAEEGKLSPALTTHCYEAVLALPGGKILKPDAKFLGRIMGLPDDFVYPHHKDGRTKTSVAATVIGNGVPVELSNAVIGGVIEYAYAQTYGQAMYSTQDEEIPIREGEYTTEEGEYSIRDDMDTRNIIASILLDQIRNQEDKETLRRYLETSNIQRAALDRRDELIKMLRTPGVATAEQLAEAKKELASIRKAIQTREQALNEIETQPRIQTLIRNQYDTIKEYERLMIEEREASEQRLAEEREESRQRIAEERAGSRQKVAEERERGRQKLAEEREKRQQKIRELRAKMNEKIRAEIDKRIEMRRDLMAQARQQRANDFYIPRIEKTFASMRKNLEKAPEAFRAPFYAFMSAIDFRTLDKDGNVRMTRNVKVDGQKVAVPNVANIRKAELMDALDVLAKGDPVKGTRPWYEEYGVIANEDILDWIEDTRNQLKVFVSMMSKDINVHQATPEMLQNLYQLARMFDSTIKHLSKAYTNANLDISDVAKQFRTRATELGTRKNNRVGRVETFLRYENAQPITVFDRMGEAGQTLFNILAKGQDKYALNYQEILDYAKDWDKKALRHWTKDVIKVRFGDEDVEMTPAQMIALYLTAENADGRRHLLEGGFKLGERKMVRKKLGFVPHTIVDTTRQITEEDLQNLVETMNDYSPELISTANKISNFLNTTAKRWANQVSIARYGYEQFTVAKYFPLFSVKSDAVGDVDKFRAQGDMPGSFYGFLNRSFTKERQVNADDALVISDVFDVFSDYVGNVALYNAFALPVLDVARFLGYSERGEDGKTLWSVADKLTQAYGKGERGKSVMQNYIENLLDDINGQQYATNSESLGLSFVRMRNRVAVAANLRVTLQQPFSIVRAADVISPKFFRPFKFGETLREMREHAPIALWKNQNSADADIKMPLRDELVGAKSDWGEAARKVTDFGMKGAQFGDDMTWAAIWNACKNYVKETSPGLEEKQFFEAVNAKFKEVIYRTQVVDSVLQKSELMREKNFFAKMISAFKSEPTTSYNMLLRQYDRLTEAIQRGDGKAAWNTLRGPMLKTTAVFLLNGIVNALVTALVDAMRDDDDYEKMYEKVGEAFFGEYSDSNKLQNFLRSNLFEGINPLGIPGVADVISLLQGYEPDRVDLIAVEGALTLPATIKRVLANPTTKDVFKLFDVFSKVSGFPVSNVFRDVLSIWNSTFGLIDPNLKRQLSPESAKSGYEALYKAMTEGKDVRAAQLVDEINGNIGDPDKAYQGVTGIMRDAYKKGDLTRDEARKYLSMVGDYFEIDRTEKQIESRIDGWDEQKQN